MSRGTLTLLPNGEAVLGCPDSVSQEEAMEVAGIVRAWVDTPGKILVLPWPVDVVDLRSGVPRTGVSGAVKLSDFTITCTCPKYPPNYTGDVLPNPACPIHRDASTYTWDGYTTGAMP